MAKLDNSTYKEIKNSRKLKEESRFEKGRYGHWKYYRNIRLLFAGIILAVIIASVILSLAIFHTKKTVFIIIACIMAIPFARNVTDLFIVFKAKALSSDDHKELEEIASAAGHSLNYDLSITEEDGVLYIPCALIASNNIIAYTPEETDARKRENIKKALEEVNSRTDQKYRIFVTEKKSTFIKEIKKIRTLDEDDKAVDNLIKLELFSMGI